MISQDWNPEPFPEPSTYPKGWNMSELVRMESSNGSKSEEDQPVLEGSTELQ
jgi:hypothetical protein